MTSTVQLNALSLFLSPFSPFLPLFCFFGFFLIPFSLSSSAFFFFPSPPPYNFFSFPFLFLLPLSEITWGWIRSSSPLQKPDTTRRGTLWNEFMNCLSWGCSTDTQKTAFQDQLCLRRSSLVSGRNIYALLGQVGEISCNFSERKDHPVILKSDLWPGKI